MIDIGGVAFTTGQIAAMPDFVRSLEAMYALPPLRLLEIRAALEEKMADPDSFDDARWMELFGDEYAELTFANADHFGTMAAMDGDLEGTNVGVWAESHDGALALAAEAHRTGAAALADRAIATEAFGSHYLQDAFSSGHLFDKAASVERAGEVGWFDRKALVARAASRVFDAAPDVIARYEVRDIAWRPFVRGSFVALLEAADVVEARAFDNAPAGAIHDQLSKQGVPVYNDLGAWTMYGDDHMAADPNSARYATLASERGMGEVKDAIANGAPSDRDVLGLVPRPTDEGRALVEGTVEHFHTDDDGGLLDGLTQQLTKQVESLLDGAAAQLPERVRRVAGEAPDEGREAPDKEPEGPKIPGGERGGGSLPETGKPREVVVAPGDWLSTIAERVYGDPQRYDVLFAANRDPDGTLKRIPGFTDPDVIEPGWTLCVPDLARVDRRG